MRQTKHGFVLALGGVPRHRSRLLLALLAVLIAMCSTGLATPSDSNEAINALALRLADEQIKSGDDAGIWPFEPGFTGSIAAGMATAYERTCDDSYKNAAELAGQKIINSEDGGFGDENYALVRLSQIADDANDNIWRTALTNFFNNVKYSGEYEDTLDYINTFYNNSFPATGVFYIANNTVAAFYVDAEDKQIWRDALIQYLSLIDNTTADAPVFAVGVATWALAKTGSLDDTDIDDASLSSRPYWDGKNLDDLPAILASHQYLTGTFRGSFYWLLDPATPGNEGGYTENAIFATLGLAAASKSNPGLIDYDTVLDMAKTAVFRGIYIDGATGYGTVYWYLDGSLEEYYSVAGEMLWALDALIIEGDLNLDDTVGTTDLEAFGQKWLNSSSGGCWSNGADIDRSGLVNFIDYALLAENWEP